MLLSWNKKVIALLFNLHAKSPERVGNDAKVLYRHIFYSDTVAYHGCHADERAYFYHIGKYAVLRSFQRFHTLNGEQIAANAADFRAHGVEHIAQLLQVRLASSIVYRGCTFCQDSCHNDIGCARNRCFV